MNTVNACAAVPLSASDVGWNRQMLFAGSPEHVAVIVPL
jgi:hypothetical protein